MAPIIHINIVIMMSLIVVHVSQVLNVLKIVSVNISINMSFVYCFEF